MVVFTADSDCAGDGVVRDVHNGNVFGGKLKSKWLLIFLFLFFFLLLLRSVINT